MTRRLVASNISDGQMIFEISQVPLARSCFIGCKPQKSLDRNVRSHCDRDAVLHRPPTETASRSQRLRRRMMVLLAPGKL
jgi:hypothetical protein